MAAVAELCFLLFALINNNRGEESIQIKHERDSYTFRLPKEANYCLISRSVGEEKLVLWNTSAIRESETSTVPEDLKPRLSVDITADSSSYTIQNLSHSDSGLYREQCWGNATHENNVSIIICTTKNEDTRLNVMPGQSIDLPCEGAADGQDVHWFKEDGFLTRVSRDSDASVMDGDGGRPQVVKTSLRLQNHYFRSKYERYVCLVMNHQRCVSSQTLDLFSRPFIMYIAVGDTAVMPCSVNRLADDQTPVWRKYGTEETWTTSSDTEPERLNKSAASKVTVQNSSLVISSLTLNDSGHYICKISSQEQMFSLAVCPKAGPLVVQLFSEGDNITFRCRGWSEGMLRVWFIRSNQTGGEFTNLIHLAPDLRSKLNNFGPNGSLILSNVSLEDAGDYWCILSSGSDFTRCATTTKILLKLREPPGFQLTVYIVRCWVLTGLLLILCVTVVAVTKTVGRGETDT